jgi:hypothetical protein
MIQEIWMSCPLGVQKFKSRIRPLALHLPPVKWMYIS